MKSAMCSGIMELQELNGVEMFNRTEGFGENVCRLRYRGNITDIHFSRDEGATNKMMMYVNMFCSKVVHVVFNVLERGF